MVFIFVNSKCKNGMSSNIIFKSAFSILLALNLFFLSAVLSYQITLRGETVEVPDVLGDTLDQARTRLVKKKLSLRQTGSQLHPSLEKDRIISQDPAPNTRVRPNNTVLVLTSAGQEKVVVPSLVGKNHQNIGPLLDEAGLGKGKISYIYTPKYAAGKIIAQAPKAEAEVARSSRISLLVSQGDRETKYLMPDLIGKRATRIITKLKEMEFKVRDVSMTFYPGLDSGIIIKQFPPQGYRIQRRDRITLEVSK